MADVDAGPNADQAAYWNTTAGETWVELQERLDRQIEPLGLAAIAALAPQPGERIVDVGCGCGQSSLELARRVGAGGQVTGVDLSQPMLAVARRRAAAAGQGWATFLQADAQTHPFAPGHFDAAFSRFGVMFFADPAAAFGNILAALRPGGRLAFVCWRPMAENAWMRIPLAAGLGVLPAPPPPDPLAPGPFAFADPARVTAILAAAGFADIAVHGHDQQIGGGDLDQTVALALKVGPLGALLREAPQQAAAVAQSLRDALRPHLTPQGVMLDSATWIVRARKPAA